MVCHDSDGENMRESTAGLSSVFDRSVDHVGRDGCRALGIAACGGGVPPADATENDVADTLSSKGGWGNGAEGVSREPGFVGT